MVFDPQPTAASSAAPSVSGEAQSAVERLMKKRGAVVQVHAPAVTGQPLATPKYVHLAAWGEGKTRKTSFGLRARSTEIRLRGEGDALSGYTPGPVVLPSGPLAIALANFDRDQSTVLADLPQDSQIVEERFYCRSDGELYIPALMSGNDWKQLFEEYVAFTRDALSAGMDLLTTDGGTVMWEHIRSWQFGSDEAEKEAAPKDYAGANSQMRERVMSRTYAAQINTLITREAAEVWKSASGPATDAAGNPLMKADGWKHTAHYIDLDLYFRIAEKRLPDGSMGPAYIARGTNTSIKANLLGKEWTDPTFAQVFKDLLGQPLIRNEDRQQWEELKAEHGDNLEW